MSKRYEVNVLGIIWQGIEATYSYHFDHIPDLQEIKRRAGDFQSISDYEIVETGHSGSWERHVTTHKITKAWDSENSEDAFLEAQGY